MERLPPGPLVHPCRGRVEQRTSRTDRATYVQDSIIIIIIIITTPITRRIYIDDKKLLCKLHIYHATKYRKK